MMFIRSFADFNGTPWAVQVTVGAITVTAQATSSPDRHDKQGSGDFYLAISGDLQLATSGDLHMATDTYTADSPLLAPCRPKPCGSSVPWGPLVGTHAHFSATRGGQPCRHVLPGLPGSQPEH